MTSTAAGSFSAPAEVVTFDGVLSDFDGTIIDSTDGTEALLAMRMPCDRIES